MKYNHLTLGVEQHRRRCVPSGKKVIYSTYDEAVVMAQTVSKERGEEMNVFACEHCKRYHIGHTPKKEMVRL